MMPPASQWSTPGKTLLVRCPQCKSLAFRDRRLVTREAIN